MSIVGKTYPNNLKVEGVKYDHGKPRMELLPTKPLEEIAKVLTFGAEKYDEWNWARGFKWSRVLGAVLRHVFSFLGGEDKDPETGLSHLAHAGCGILFILDHELNRLGTDDRRHVQLKETETI